MAENDEKTDQDEKWGTFALSVTPGYGSSISQASGSGGYFGHSWLKVTSRDKKTKTFGTFKKGVVQDGWNQGRTFQVNYERDKLYEANTFLSSEVSITKKQRLLLDLMNQSHLNNGWELGNNCTDYAVDIWQAITKQDLYPKNGYRTLSELYNILKNAIIIYAPVK